jgi:hypothetical protein
MNGHLPRKGDFKIVFSFLGQAITYSVRIAYICNLRVYVSVECGVYGFIDHQFDIVITDINCSSSTIRVHVNHIFNGNL